MRKPKMVCIRWCPRTDQAGLPRNKFQVHLVSDASRLRERQNALIDLRVRFGLLSGSVFDLRTDQCNVAKGVYLGRRGFLARCTQSFKLGRERRLDDLRIPAREGRLELQRSSGPSLKPGSVLNLAELRDNARSFEL